MAQLDLSTAKDCVIEYMLALLHGDFEWVKDSHVLQWTLPARWTTRTLGRLGTINIMIIPELTVFGRRRPMVRHVSWNVPSTQFSLGPLTEVPSLAEGAHRIVKTTPIALHRSPIEQLLGALVDMDAAEIPAPLWSDKGIW